jgi:hypothetical protein
MKHLMLAAVMLVGCATTTQQVVRPASLPRIQSLEAALAAAEQYPCVAGLHAIPATVIEAGVFQDVPYQSFSNGTVEVNAYGDPGDLVGLEAGTRTEDPVTQQCLVQFIAAQTLTEADRQRVLRMTAAPLVDPQPGLTVEVTPRTAADAYDAWWISLERPEAIAAARASPEQTAQVTQAQNEWQPPPPTYYRRPPRPFVRYPSYRVVPRPSVRVYVPGFSRRGGVYLRFR